MKLFKISQSRNLGWYTYDSAIVVAETKDEARNILPSPFYFFDNGFYYKYKNQEAGKEKQDPSWCHPRFVKVEEIGDTIRKAGEVVNASFKWGFDESRYLDMRRLGGRVASGQLTEEHLAQHIATLQELESGLHDQGLAELRYHLIEANRAHDLARVQEYELKVRDYMNEVYEDWS